MPLAMVSPAATGMLAHATWPRNFTAGCMPRMSSAMPSAAISTAPAMRPRAAGSPGRNHSAGSRKPITMAMPPRRGMGRSWMRRAEGWSTAPTLRASAMVAGVRMSTTTAAAIALSMGISVVVIATGFYGRTVGTCAATGTRCQCRGRW